MALVSQVYLLPVYVYLFELLLQTLLADRWLLFMVLVLYQVREYLLHKKLHSRVVIVHIMGLLLIKGLYFLFYYHS